MTNVYQPLFDKLDATIADLEVLDKDSDVLTVAADAADLLKRLGIVAASLLNGSVAAFAHLILETEQVATEGGSNPSGETDGDEEGQEPSE